MGSLTSVTSLVGVGMNAYQSYQKTREDNLQAELAAADLEAQAGVKDQAAAATLKEGRLAMFENTLKGRAERSTQRVAYAASGVKVDTGSAARVVADQAAWNEYERQKIEYRAKLESWGLASEAADLRTRAASARASQASPGKAVTSSLVSSVGSLLSKL